MADKTKIIVELEFEHYSANFPRITGILVNGERQELSSILEEDRRGLKSWCIIDFGLDDSTGVITLSQKE